MAKTVDTARTELMNLRREIKDGLKQTLAEKGYDVDDTIRGEEMDITIDMDWDHILAKSKYRSEWSHIDNLSTDDLLKCWREAVIVWPKM